MIPNLREVLAKEFMAEWKSYATVELEKEKGLSDEDNERRVELLTRLLFEAESEATADRAARDQAIQILSDWLNENENENNPMWVRLTLRHILYLHRMNRFGVALKMLEDLAKRDHQFEKLASFQCLWGNLLAHTGDRLNARGRFEAAIRIASTWCEPHLENIENLIVLGQFREAATTARDSLKNRGLNGRAQVLLRANLLVARCIDETAYPGSDEYVNDMHAARGVPVDFRESWRFASLHNVTIDSQLTDQVKREVIRLLRELGTKIRPANDADPDPITPFG